MKRLLSLLLLCLFLAGCEEQAPATVPTTQPAAQTPQTLPTEPPRGLYDPSHPLEGGTEGAVRVYPLESGAGTNFYPMGEDILLLSGEEKTTLRVFSGDTLIPTAEITLEFSLSEDENALQVWEDRLSYFDPLQRKTILLDSELQEIRQIAAPADLVGTPLLSSDGATLYYCTADALRSWDLETGIRRYVKEMTFHSQCPTGLYQQDTVLRCQVEQRGIRRTILLDTVTGALLWEGPQELELLWEGDGYMATLREGGYRRVHFGREGENPLVLTPKEFAAVPYLLDDRRVVTVQYGEEGYLFDCYDLPTGRRLSRITLEGKTCKAVKAAGEQIWVLLDDTLLRWSVQKGNPLDPGEEAVYTGPKESREDPDLEGLEECRAEATALGEKYGVEIFLWEDGAATEPWDYDLVPEFSVPALRHGLKVLDTCLSRYPEGMLADTKDHFTALKFCLVRQISPTAESGATGTVNGLQFFDGSDAYVVLASGETLEQAVYHELFHVMQTHILGGSTALDRWNELNPEGFSYDMDYTGTALQGSEQYLSGEGRYFVDAYSMSFPKEDQARVMEYAMLPGNRELFRGRNMQRKLEALCEGIRRSYGLRKSPETFLWEQYLECPMACTE